MRRMSFSKTVAQMREKMLSGPKPPRFEVTTDDSIYQFVRATFDNMEALEGTRAQWIAAEALRYTIEEVQAEAAAKCGVLLDEFRENIREVGDPPP